MGQEILQEYVRDMSLGHEQYPVILDPRPMEVVRREIRQHSELEHPATLQVQEQKVETSDSPPPDQVLRDLGEDKIESVHDWKQNEDSDPELGQALQFSALESNFLLTASEWDDNPVLVNTVVRETVIDEPSAASPTATEVARVIEIADR